jgi:N-acetylneuraminic acid mutarotase
MPRLSVLLFLFIASFSFSQEWTSISPIPTIGRDDGVAFSLNNLGFVVTGSGDDSNYSESNRLFCYNPETNSWTEKAPFPGVKRQYSSVFTIDDIAYLIGGYSEIGTALNDVWSYDAALDEWIQRSNFPGLQRWDATSTSMSRVGYYGLGTTQIGTMSDLWQYFPENDDWSLLCYYAGDHSRSVLAFPLFDKIIFGEGFSVYTGSVSYTDEWYIFEPENCIWRLIDSPVGLRSYGTAVSNGSYALICGGMNEDAVFQNNCYQLTYSQDWETLNPIGTEGLRGSSGFVIGNDFYVGTGLKADGTKTSEFFKISLPGNDFNNTIVFPNPSSTAFNIISVPESEVTIYSIDGKLMSESTTDETGYLNIENLNPGIFLLKIQLNDTEMTLRIEKI